MTSTRGSEIVLWCGIHLIHLTFQTLAQSSSDSLRGIESIGEAVYHDYNAKVLAQSVLWKVNISTF